MVLTGFKLIQNEIIRVVRAIVGAVLMAYALSMFFSYDFSFWSFFTMIIGVYLFPKLHPKSYLDLDTRISKILDK